MLAHNISKHSCSLSTATYASDVRALLSAVQGMSESRVAALTLTLDRMRLRRSEAAERVFLQLPGASLQQRNTTTIESEEVMKCLSGHV